MSRTLTDPLVEEFVRGCFRRRRHGDRRRRTWGLRCANLVERGKPRFLTYESGFGGETDSPLEEDGFELAGPSAKAKAMGSHSRQT